MAVESARRHLERALTLDNWTPPTGGFSVGLQSDANGFDLNHILQQAIALSTALAEPAFSVEETEELRDTKQWVRNVRKAVSASLRGYFDRSVNVGKVRETVGFFADKYHYAAYFAVFRQDSSHLGTAFSAAQSKLWKLDQLRDRLPLVVSRTELIIGKIPAQGDSISAQLDDYISELSEEAAMREIQVQQTQYPAEAAAALERACRLAS